MWYKNKKKSNSVKLKEIIKYVVIYIIIIIYFFYLQN